jgi:hypothetical protein
MKGNWSIRVVRAIFFALSVFTGHRHCLGFFSNPLGWVPSPGAGFMAILLVLDHVMARFTLRDLSYAIFGLLIGLFGAWLITRVGVFQLAWFQTLDDGDTIRNIIEICVYGDLRLFWHHLRSAE